MRTDDEQIRKRFLVELDPASGGCEPGLLTRRLRTAADGAGPVRVLRTVYVPEDGSSYLLVEASSAGEIGPALRAIGIAARPAGAAIQAEILDTRGVRGSTDSGGAT